MSGAPLQTDMNFWHALRTRRRRLDPLSGPDATANRWINRIKQSRKNMRLLNRQAAAVVAQENTWSNYTDDQLNERAMELRQIMARRKYDDEQFIAMFAAVRELCFRAVGKRPYKVQIMGAMGLFHGLIVEMVTGEGKTLTAAVAASALGWLRRPIHVITVNDYLAERDADEQNAIYRRCGLVAGSIIGDTEEAQRKAIYRQPIVYITQKELVADWLRDQLKLRRVTDPVSMRWLLESMLFTGAERGRIDSPVLVPGLHVAIVDEIDAVLIDEAVTPLIIAQPRQEDAQSQLYVRARDMGLALDIERDYTIEQSKRKAKITAAGREKLYNMLTESDHAIWQAMRRREELVEQALVAEHCYHARTHYQLVEDKVVIIDEYSGRFMEDRTWQHGLHQAVEAKHDLEITADRDTLASMSFQRFFKQYPHLCGMTGTADESRGEMETTYGLPVRIIPTHRPILRKLLPTLIFTTAEYKWNAIADEIDRMNQQGRPVLVGTRSIETSEVLSELLEARGVEHQVLNAVHHKLEAQIIAQAGSKGAVTVATNMAGRGTDIKLAKGLADIGGLHVILTERHTARRVDRQLFGRSGRQGDQGSARVIICLEDDLLVKHAAKSAALLRARFGKRKKPLPGWVSRVFDIAQKRAQKQSLNSRMQVLKQDQELDKSLPI